MARLEVCENATTCYGLSLLAIILIALAFCVRGCVVEESKLKAQIKQSAMEHQYEKVTKQLPGLGDY